MRIESGEVRTTWLGAFARPLLALLTLYSSVKPNPSQAARLASTETLNITASGVINV